ncbi:MAG: TlpA family protein disulfide reductase [Sulfuriflexus sp.]|nr:TlpA family protein disulfide reductase [Sulfuriflexus sp.]
MVANKNNPIIRLMTGLLLLLSASLANAGPLTDLDGTAASINDYTGKDKWLVVMFWASDCHICNKEAHQYVDMHARHKDGNINVLGVTTDGMENKAAAQVFITENKLNFPNLIGSLEDIAGMYYDLTGNQWVGTPTFFIYNPEGKLRIADAGAIPAKLIEEFIEENS